MGTTRLDPTKPISDFSHFKVTCVYRQPGDPRGLKDIESTYFYKKIFGKAVEEILLKDSLK
jgi:hypothetical protein